MATRRGLVRAAVFLVGLVGLGGCKLVTQHLEREIFAETLELTMERPSDLRPPEGQFFKGEGHMARGGKPILQILPIRSP